MPRFQRPKEDIAAIILYQNYTKIKQPWRLDISILPRQQIMLATFLNWKAILQEALAISPNTISLQTDVTHVKILAVTNLCVWC